MLNNTFYKAPYEYLIGVPIYEYDIKAANVSVLRHHNIIDDQQYQSYLKAPKKEREVEMGIWLKQLELYDLFKQTVAEARQWFFKENHIEDHQILYIDNDSITLIDRLANNTQYSQYIDFKQKNTYNSFYRLGRVDFLYYSDNDQESYRIKYGGTKLNLIHKDGFLDLLLSIANEAQNRNYQAMVLMIKHIYKQYIDRQFPIEYYREFNQKSEYKLIPGYAFQYYTNIPPEGLNSIDISYNANLLRYLSKIFYKEYFKKG